MEVAVPWNRRIAESQVVRRDEDEAAASKDGAGGRALETLSPGFARGDDVRIRRGVVEGDSSAAHIRNGRERSGPAGYGEHARRERHARFRLTWEQRIRRAVTDFVAVESVF